MHADYQVKKFFSLNHLGDGLATDCCLNHRFHIRHINSVAGNPVAIDINQEAGLAKLAHNSQIGKARHVVEGIFYLHRFVLKDVQVVAIDFDRQRTLQAGQGFVDRILGGLGVVKNNSRKRS